MMVAPHGSRLTARFWRRAKRATIAVTAVAIDPEDEQIVYAAISIWLGTHTAHLSPVGVVVSVDGGRQWLQMSRAKLSDTQVWRLEPVAGQPLSVVAINSTGSPTVSLKLSPELLGLLHDGDPAVRASAARAIGLIGDPAALPGLMQGLTDPDALAGQRIAEAIGRIGDRSVSADLLNVLAICADSGARQGRAGAWHVEIRGGRAWAGCVAQRRRPGRPADGGRGVGGHRYTCGHGRAHGATGRPTDDVGASRCDGRAGDGRPARRGAGGGSPARFERGGPRQRRGNARLAEAGRGSCQRRTPWPVWPGYSRTRIPRCRRRRPGRWVRWTPSRRAWRSTRRRLQHQTRRPFWRQWLPARSHRPRWPRCPVPSPMSRPTTGPGSDGGPVAARAAGGRADLEGAAANIAP